MNRRALARALLVAALAAGPAFALEMPSRTAPGADARAFGPRAPHTPAWEAFALPPDKAAAPREGARGRIVGGVRAVGSNAGTIPGWQPVPGGWVARVAVSSPGAQGLRARIRLPAGIAAGEVTARGPDGEVHGSPAAAGEAWTAYTGGARQEIEIFSRTRPAAAPAVESIVHFDVSPTAKETAGACSPDVACTSDDAARDAAIAERRHSVALVSFVEGTEARVCSGTLINTDRFPAPYVVTANHCIATAAAAASVTTLWFNEVPTCGAAASSATPRQVSGGAQLVFSSHAADSTLLLLARDAPAGAVFAGWDTAPLAAATDVVSISHPQGDVKKFALGTKSAELLVKGYPQTMHGVSYTRGVTEGGSSGSGLFTLSGGSLRLRGVLSGSTLRSGNLLSCANQDREDALFGRWEIFHPQIAGFIAADERAPDAIGNRPSEAFRLFLEPSPNPSDTPTAARIDYPGDVDVFRIDIPRGGATLTVRTTGSLDTVGTLLDASGRTLKSVNDAEADRIAFGLTRTLEAGTYYVSIATRDPLATGDYTFLASLANVGDNYTDLWWNPDEPGWGLGLTHQGHLLFGTLFVYDRQGNPTWFVMSVGERDSGNLWKGPLYRFNRPGAPQAGSAPVGTLVGQMRLTFTSNSEATLSYLVDGEVITKKIKRQVYSLPPVCRWSSFDRSLTTNFQDLWWNPATPGWGLYVAHQGSIILSALFTYDAKGDPMWYAMSRGQRISDGLYIGEFVSFTGPPYSAPAWSPVSPTVVGTMTMQFTRGNAGSIAFTVDGSLEVSPIERQAFSTPLTECLAPGDE